MTVMDGIDEIKKLHELLEAAGVEHICKTHVRAFGSRNQILVKKENEVLSAICHLGSYGWEGGFLECWDFSDEEPAGWLTADEAFEWMVEHGAR